MAAFAFTGLVGYHIEDEKVEEQRAVEGAAAEGGLRAAHGRLHPALTLNCGLRINSRERDDYYVRRNYHREREREGDRYRSERDR